MDDDSLAKPVLSGHDAVATHFPEQNVLLQAAKGRISNYLNSLRPSKNEPKLAFDKAPDQRSKEKSYNRALDIANHPLSVVDEIRKGTIEPDHIKHLKAMYPEVLNQLQKKITERITKAQLKDEKPPAKIRQGLSMFMGTALTGSLLPENIQAAQSVFAKKAVPEAGGEGKPKKSTSPLTKMADSSLTADQARVERQNKV